MPRRLRDKTKDYPCRGQSQLALGEFESCELTRANTAEGDTSERSLDIRVPGFDLNHNDELGSQRLSQSLLSVRFTGHCLWRHANEITIDETFT